LLQARLVVAWLGPAAHESDRAIKALNHWPARFALEEKFVYPGAICTLFERQFWSRIWIVQETLLGREVRFLCGHSSFQFEQMNDLSITLGKRHHIQATSAMNLLRAKFEYDEATGIGNKAIALNLLAKKFDGMHASNTHDRVYGLLGLVEHKGLPTEEELITVDYGRSDSELYTDVLKAVHKYVHATDANVKIKDLGWNVFSSLSRISHGRAEIPVQVWHDAFDQYKDCPYWLLDDWVTASMYVRNPELCCGD
jgi:hypothetical protein